VLKLCPLSSPTLPRQISSLFLCFPPSAFALLSYTSRSLSWSIFSFFLSLEYFICITKKKILSLSISLSVLENGTDFSQLSNHLRPYRSRVHM